MQSEQVLFEGRNCPVRQIIETRQEHIDRVMREREKNKRLERRAQEAEWQARYDQGFTSL